MGRENGASIVVPSAEGETTYRGREGDPDPARTSRFFETEFLKIARRHPLTNRSYLVERGYAVDKKGTVKHDRGLL